MGMHAADDDRRRHAGHDGDGGKASRMLNHFLSWYRPHADEQQKAMTTSHRASRFPHAYSL